MPQFVSYGGSGSGGSGTMAWTDETVVGAVNGVNTAFTVSVATVDAGTFNLFLDGTKLYLGTDFTRVGTAITMLSAPLPGQTLWANYRSV